MPQKGYVVDKLSKRKMVDAFYPQAKILFMICETHRCQTFNRVQALVHYLSRGTVVLITAPSLFTFTRPFFAIQLSSQFDFDRRTAKPEILTTQLSKPFIFGHQTVLLGGFSDIDAT